MDHYMKHGIPQQQKPKTLHAMGRAHSDVTDDTEPEVIGAVWLMFDSVSDRTWSGCTSPSGSRYAPVSGGLSAFLGAGMGRACV